MTILHSSGVCLVTKESSDEYVIQGPRAPGHSSTYSKAYVFGREVNLSLFESKILELLILNEGRYVTRDRILDYLGDTGDVSDRSVDTIIKKLRKKLFPGNHIASKKFIKTIYRRGYIIPKRQT